MHTIQIWTLAVRPNTLIASISPVLIATTMAIKIGNFDWLIFLCTMCTALGIQVTTNLANDYFDYLKGADTYQRKGFMRVTQAKLVSHKAMRQAIIISMLLTLLSGIYLMIIGKALIACLLIISLCLSILYTAGPYPLAYLGLGELLAFIFFGPIAVSGAYYLQIGSLPLEALLAGIAPGAISTAILIVNNVRDINEDRLVNKKTLAARFGKSFGKWEYLFCLLTAFGSLFFFYNSHPFALCTLLCLLPAGMLVKTMFTHKSPMELNLLLIKTGQLLCLFTALLCIGWML
ncbi:1,4-dihydroxy-2-naphthoate octaprenyltransferase [Candidatus Rhabdochlamydia porcellionis]|uniref:1,4-dihydroxy-2-naphthoate octaprenyltransferase n=1 Tax=Candidatus Rhabdochlamydia porcellionis TaxID=225148 RepID=A0ABX8YZA6_9BACT|nr:1,4-dihydroxy-2-naphthoate octaprenyltransferase [Candidatus Rhabdochlamydia porcellionis]QZA58704.1 dihydroxy-naphthoate octaprenyltransferase [Candidatus Rhabdochlamydia porcellionis]